MRWLRLLTLLALLGGNLGLEHFLRQSERLVHTQQGLIERQQQIIEKGRPLVKPCVEGQDLAPGEGCVLQFIIPVEPPVPAAAPAPAPALGKRS
jgi:hypothetical protein